MGVNDAASLFNRLFQSSPYDRFLPAKAKAVTNSILSHLEAGRLRKAVSTLFASPFQFPFPLYARLFQLCSAKRAIVEVRKIESHLVTYSHPPPTFLLNRAIEAYGKCGCLRDARELFDEMPRRDGGSWNAMITAYAQGGCPDVGLRLFWDMNRKEVFANEVTFASVLGSCAAILELCLSRQIHGLIVKYGFQGNVILGSSLVDVYGKCWMMMEARRMFDEIENPNAVSWNVIVRRYLEVGDVREAFSMFCNMIRAGETPLTFTFSNALVACSGSSAFKEGTQVHGVAVKIGYDEDEVVSCSLIGMYVKCGNLDCAWKIFNEPYAKSLISWTSMVSGYAMSGRTPEARELFNKMPERSIVSWNAMLTGYTQFNLWEDALNLIFLMLHEEKCKLDYVTLGLVLNVCSGLSNVEFGRQVHGYIYRHGFCYNVFVCNSLLDMYGKCGCLKSSYTWFCQMSDFRDSVSWNSLMRSYASHHLSEEVTGIFVKMQQEAAPNEYTFSTLLASCADIFAVKHGKEIHGFTIRNGYAKNVFVLGAMVDMYSKCGLFDYALRVFQEASPGSVILWNSMILGCCHHHRWEEALQLFEFMKIEGVRADHVTFLAVLQACIYGGLLSLLYSRHGVIDELEEFVKNLPFSATISMLTRVFDACREYGDSKLGNWAAEQLNQLNPQEEVDPCRTSALL
ncbi:hypothetical protein Dimus_024917 [Dionaea muscipula]